MKSIERASVIFFRYLARMSAGAFSLMLSRHLLYPSSKYCICKAPSQQVSIFRCAGITERANRVHSSRNRGECVLAVQPVNASSTVNGSAGVNRLFSPTYTASHCLFSSRR